MSTVNVNTKNQTNHAFNVATAYEEDGYLVVKDVESSVVARFALRELKAWWTDDD